MSVASFQLGASSSHDGSTVSGDTEYDDYRKPTADNLEAMNKKTAFYEQENKLFIEYARRKGKEIFPQGAVVENNTRARRNLKRRGKVPQFPTNRKLEMANHVIGQIESDIKNTEKQGANDIAEIRAGQVQIGYREKEIEKEVAAFTRDVIEDGTDDRSGAIIGEKLLRWYDDLIKSKDVKIGKLRLKRDSMKSQIARTRARLQQKLELGEKLQQVDYDQLQINNDAFQKEIEELSQKLADLQKRSSSVVSRLNRARTSLANEEKQVETMESSIKQKEKAIDKHAREAEHVEEDHKKLELSNEDIAAKKSEFRVPDVSDYIDKKAKIYELSKVIRNWERKVQLAEMNVKRLRKDLEAMDTPR